MHTLDKTGFCYHDIDDDIRITARKPQKLAAKGTVRAFNKRTGEPIEEKRTRCPKSVFDSFVEKYS